MYIGIRLINKSVNKEVIMQALLTGLSVIAIIVITVVGLIIIIVKGLKKNRQ